MYARSGDVHLAYQVIGEGPRDIVLVLDWASHLEALWEQALVAEFVASLNRFARVIWFDVRGVGLSDRVAEGTVSADDWLEDVSAVMTPPARSGRRSSRTATPSSSRCCSRRPTPSGSIRWC